MYKSKKVNKVLGIVLGISFSLVLAVYLGFSVYFIDRFYFGSVINGVEYGGKTKDEVEQSIDDDIKNYRLNLTGREGVTDTISADEIGLRYVSDGKVGQLKEEQNPFLWFVGTLQEKNHELIVTTAYDEAALRAKFDSMAFFKKGNSRKPVNAYIDFTGEEYSIVEEDRGTLLDKEKVYAQVEEAVRAGETEILLDEIGAYKNPKILKDHKPMQKAVGELNQYIQAEIRYDFSDREELLDKNIIYEWLKVDKSFNVTVEEQAVIDYIKTLEAVYNTLGKSRQFETTSGKLVQVPSGNYGFMISRGREKDAILELIKEGAKVKREPEYAQRGYVRDTNDIGDTYVEINLAKQYMWFYKDGEILVKTKIVTGNVSRNYATPVGVYGITYKERNATLTGEDYATPVNYWLPFNGDIGIHDALWREKFGGKEYMKNGSHGCVNTPYKNAKVIYENIEKGMPVICY